MKAIKAWAMVSKDGIIHKIALHVLSKDCPFAIYSSRKPLEGELNSKMIRVEIREVKGGGK
jgi:hypothetical protein